MVNTEEIRFLLFSLFQIYFFWCVRLGASSDAFTNKWFKRQMYMIIHDICFVLLFVCIFLRFLSLLLIPRREQELTKPSRRRTASIPLRCRCCRFLCFGILVIFSLLLICLIWIWTDTMKTEMVWQCIRSNSSKSTCCRPYCLRRMLDQKKMYPMQTNSARKLTENIRKYKKCMECQVLNYNK